MIKLKTRDVERSNYRNYLQKAEECMLSATDGFQKGLWNSCSISAIHSAISAADAICTYYLGKRYAGDRHDSTVDLLRSVPIDKKSLDQNTIRLVRVISIKNLAEYEDRLLHRDDAENIIQNSQRFLEFARRALPK